LLNRPLSELFPNDEVFRDVSCFFRDSHPTFDVDFTPPAMSGLRRILRLTVVYHGPGTEMAVALVADVTEEQARSASLEKRHKKEAVTGLIGALMHHINQPLTVIALQAHLLQLNLDKPGVDRDAVRQGLREIGELSLQIAALLGKVKDPVEVANEVYLGDKQILDLERASGHAVESSCARLMAALDLHQPGAIEHGRRTAALAVRLAAGLEIDPALQAAIRRGAYLHDIGKIGVAPDVLRISNKLNSAETNNLRRHAEIGYEILRGFQGLEQESEIAHMHHEWFDGNGYPQRLRGSNITLPAAIVAVANSYEVLCLERPDHPAQAHIEALSIIGAGSGTQFHPDVVAVLQTLPTP
jgi:putative nucleotidyltransferase with HDIG domain